ncbi:DUF2812 domain-containing protein [Ruminococcus sp.]|uniref:DUF2812 domain-containing protein n=1 Tax=Ruminococcus sp. TaxID=41978 RepID=UPI00388E0714
MDNSNFTKFKMFFSLDKELEFINKMNREGWKLVYIKGGCFYTFEKTEPDEYFTILHATSKDKVLEISSFAAQCGYQPIPHTMDGIGDFLYLTGRKGEVSSEFVCEAPEKIDSAKRIYHRFQALSIAFIIVSVLLVLECTLILWPIMTAPESSIVLIVVGVMFILFVAVYIAMCIYMNLLTAKARRNMKQLQKESEIYE